MVSSQHTTESIYYTPWSYPCIVLDSNSKVPKFRNDQKQSVSNAFQYVVLHPQVDLSVFFPRDSAKLEQAPTLPSLLGQFRHPQITSQPK